MHGTSHSPKLKHYNGNNCAVHMGSVLQRALVSFISWIKQLWQCTKLPYSRKGSIFMDRRLFQFIYHRCMRSCRYVHIRTEFYGQWINYENSENWIPWKISQYKKYSYSFGMLEKIDQKEDQCGSCTLYTVVQQGGGESFI